MRLPRPGKRALLALGATALVAGGVYVALGPAAAWVIDTAADGQRVWRLGTIKVDDVSGGWLGDLRAGRVTLEDEQGVWLEASDVSLEWRPFSLFGGGVRLDLARIGHATLLRNPTLTEKRPSSGEMFDVAIEDLDIDRLDIAEGVLGEAASFTAAFDMVLKDDALDRLNLDLRRTDSDADRALITYRSDADYVLAVDIDGAPGGVLAHLFGVPEQSIAVDAQGEGDLTNGGAHYTGAVGAETLLSGATTWTPTRWSSDGAVRFDLLPGLRDIGERIGERASFTASGLREGAFSARAQTPFLNLTLEGAVDENYELDGPARFVATTARLSDIARESPFELGGARAEGELRQMNGITAIRATLDASQMQVLGHWARLRGPVEASLNERAFELSANLAAPRGADPLFANARLNTRFEYDRRRARFELARTTLEGDSIALDAQGWVNGDEGEFAGGWRIKRLQALAPDLTGGGAGQWRAFASMQRDQRIWTATVAGSADRVGGQPDIVPQLLGASARLDGLFRYENNGITVSHLRVDGAKLRAAAVGRIVDGNAALALEASARGPLSLGGAEILGAVDATGNLTGPLSRPSLAASAQLSSFAASGVVVDQPQVDFTLAPAGDAYRGAANVRGSVSGQPMQAQSNIAIADGALILDELVAEAGELRAEGSATIASRGLTADLALNGALDGLMPGVTGRILGEVGLTPEALQLDAQIADARAGDLRIRAATLRAEGPMSAIAATFDMRGALRRAPLAFGGTARVSIEDGVTTALIEGEGALAGADIATRAPINARFSEGALDASLDMRVEDGAVVARWQDRGRTLSGQATIEDAPIAPLAAIWGETATGRIDGRVNVANAGNGLAGDGDLTFTDARFAGRQRGTLNLRVVGDLDPNRLRATVDARSSGGLVAHFEADAPVTTSIEPLRIALARDRRGSGSWTINGPAETLWSAARLQDQTLAGALNGEGQIEFGAGHLSGAGHIEIVDGRFEDKLSGIILTDLDARISIGDRGVNIENFTATGPRGGRLTATGGSANPNEGRIAVNVQDMWVANRPDARARASGDLTLAWQGLDATLSGDLAIAQADISIAQNPEAGIPTLDVVEINRPNSEDEVFDNPAAPSPRAASTTLNVRITAPGRVFTRGRGIEAEWALDMRLSGTAANPRVVGEANIVRGTLSLSGQPFEFEHGAIIFNGDPMFARLDMLAERDTADLTARISIAGTPTNPEITLTSDPALPEDEILPQVLFGRSVEDLSPLEAAQIATALATLSGRSSFDLVDAARAAAGLDRFNVRQDESGGFLVAGGVYLTRDVYVEVARTGLGQAATRVEWTVRPKLVLITSFLGNGDQRVSVRWRHETD